MFRFFTILIVLTIASAAQAQSCNPASVNYLVRDEKGKILSESELKTLSEQLPETIGDAHVAVSSVSFFADRESYYWPESADWSKGIKEPSLNFANAATCTMKLGEVTLNYHGKSMRLIFNIDISRRQEDRRMVIDSVPFQAGSFQLELSDWSKAIDKLIPAKRWKKLKN